MDLDGDELAGVVDLFGALEREELRTALGELAFRRGESADEETLEESIAAAVERFHLVPVDGRLVPGPASFPSLPQCAEDLPHILDVDRRSVDRSAAAAAAEQRFREAVDRALSEDDEDRLRELREVSYDLEAWGPVDASAAREDIDDALEG